MSRDKQINSFLNQYHINHKYVGYKYLMMAIRLMLEEEVPRGHMSEAYRNVAEQFDRRPKQIEVAIHSAIQKSGMDMSNKTFITLAVDEITYQNVN